MESESLKSSSRVVYIVALSLLSVMLVWLSSGIATFAQTETVPSNIGSEAFDNITRQETPEIVNNSYSGLPHDDAFGTLFGDVIASLRTPRSYSKYRFGFI